MVMEMAKTQSRGQVEINATQLRVLMHERGFRRKTLADAVGVKIETVDAWLAATSNPLRKNFNKLCTALDIPSNMLAVNLPI